MILGDGGRGPTLDDLFRRAGVRHPHALALADAPDRERFTDGAPRALTFSQADRAISAFAAKLHSLGLHADTVVGLQLPNTVESVIALLGVLRAGMIAAPLPLLWRQRDLVDALDRAGAKIIVSSERIGGERHAELAMQVAAELFPIRYVCAFGTDADGVVPLDDVFDDAPGELMPAPHLAQPGAHVAVLTFDTTTDGIRIVARNHAQLAASGAKLAAECGLSDDG
jgi:acyl-CoA synthetase (AMP-forming)/AMP-acid ligase II